MAHTDGKAWYGRIGCSGQLVTVQPAISVFCQTQQSPHFRATRDSCRPERAFAAWTSAQAGMSPATSASSRSTVADASSAKHRRASHRLCLAVARSSSVKILPDMPFPLQNAK